MMLEKYGHGGDLMTASELFGERERWLDFSANMNPAGPPERVKEALQAAWPSIIHYPDPAVRQLRDKLAEHHGIDREHVLVGNGAAECIDLALRALQPARVGLVRPSFGEYEEAAERLGCTVVGVQLRADKQFVVDEEAAAALMNTCDTIVIGNPNNPTGRLVPRATLTALLASGCKLVVDEAFLDFAPDEAELTLIQEAMHHERLVVIRSLTKFYAMPGLRIGYAVSNGALIRRMRALQVPWSVNALAQAAGVAALEDEEYAARTRRWLAEERPRLVEALAGIGLTVYPGMPNYVLFALPDDSAWTASALQRALGERGILLRDASHFPGLGDKYCRCAVRRREDNEQLIGALRRLLSPDAVG